MDAHSIVELAKKERVVYEYNYRQNPKLAAKVIFDSFANKCIVLFPDTAHSRAVFAELTALGAIERQVAIGAKDFNGFDVVALIGYWNDEGVDAFCLEFNVDMEKIFLPYKHSVFWEESKAVESQIDALTFGGQKPEFVLIIGHEGRDFVTHSAKEISKYCRLTKIYLEEDCTCELNSYFEQILVLNKDVKSVEYFFSKYAKLISACAVFTHGMDFWKIPYTSSLLDKKTKLITLTCDWFSSILSSQDATYIMQKPVSYINMEKESEIFAMRNSDLIVTNFDKAILKQAHEGANILTSYAFMDCDKFVFKNRKKSEVMRYCFAGSLVPYDFNNGFMDIMNLLEIFKKITSQNATIDVFEAYGRELKKSQYSDLIESKKLKIKKTLQHEVLPQTLYDYDYGLLVYNLPNTLMDSLFDTIANLYQAKFIAYLASGLPVIISAEFKAMAKIVRRFECGIVVANKEVELIPDLVQKADYKAIKGGVKKFQEYYAQNIKEEASSRIFKTLFGK